MNKRSVKKRIDVNSITFEDAKTMYYKSQMSKGLVSDYVESSMYALLIFSRDMGIEDDSLVKDITLDVVNEWIEVSRNKGLKDASIGSYLSRMRTFLYWCMDNGYLERYEIHNFKMREANLKYFTDDEVNILIKKPNANCDFVEYRTWVIICFILATGARAATISNIKVDDIDFKNRLVTYNHLKNGKVANIPLSDSIYKIINDYIKEWETGSEYLFCDVGGGQLTSGAIRQAQVKYCKKRNVQHLGPHALRHSFARGWIRNGGGAFQLQQMLTHSDLTMTRRYVRLFGTDLEDDVRQYSPLDTLKRGTSRTKTVARRWFL